MNENAQAKDANDAFRIGHDVRALADQRWRSQTDATRSSGGSSILKEVFVFLGRFVAYPSENEQVAHALWVAHTHAMGAWDSTPRLAALSPEPGSGKTRLLEVTELLVPRPVSAVNVTPAYLFRKVGADDGLPTVLFDEIDTVFGPKAKGNEEIRGLLNAGHRRGAMAGRCVIKGKTVETEEISAYCAVALAGLGSLPDTILSRAIVIRMKRRSASERVEPFRRRDCTVDGDRIRHALEKWTCTSIDSLAQARPEMPSSVQDREADVWEPLLAIADFAGGEWPNRARVAAVTLVTQKKQNNPSFGIQLLSDLKSIFGDHDAMATAAILRALSELPESTWQSIRGKPLNDRGLAKLLKSYSVKPKLIRRGDDVFRGYEAADLNDAWSRYLPSA